MKLFERREARIAAPVVKENKLRGLSGKQIALFVGGGFVAALIIFYLIGNWDHLGNSFLCFAQDVAGMNSHYHFPMRDGAAYPSCSKASGANTQDGFTGINGEGNN